MDRSQLDQALDTFVRSVTALDSLRPVVVLYGSAARGDWIPGRSDVNLLLLVDDVTPTSLLRLTAAVTAWHSRGFAPPLIMSHGEWLRSADVFPIEITDMQVTHRTLCGDDPVAGMVVDRMDLREAVEKELRGKVVRLRQAYVRFGTSGQVLGGFALASISTYFALLRCVAVMRGRDPGNSPAATVGALRDELGDAQVAVEIAVHRSDPDWACPPQTFVRYLELVCRTVEFVDTYQPGVV